MLKLVTGKLFAALFIKLEFPI